jgi:hypothetical protein
MGNRPKHITTNKTYQPIKKNSIKQQGKKWSPPLYGIYDNMHPQKKKKKV